MISPWITSPAYPIHNKIIYIYPDIAILPYIHKIKKFYPKKSTINSPFFPGHSSVTFRDVHRRSLLERSKKTSVTKAEEKPSAKVERSREDSQGRCQAAIKKACCEEPSNGGFLWFMYIILNIYYILYDVIIYYMILYVYLWTYWLIWNSIVSISIYHDFSPIDLLYVLEMYKWLLNRYNRYWGWGVKSYRALTASSVDSTSNNENWPDTKKWLWLIISFCRQNHLIFRWGRLLWRLWHGLVEVETCLVRRVSRFDHRQERGGSIGGLTGLPVMVR